MIKIIPRSKNYFSILDLNLDCEQAQEAPEEEGQNHYEKVQKRKRFLLSGRDGRSGSRSTRWQWLFSGRNGNGCSCSGRGGRWFWLFSRGRGNGEFALKATHCIYTGKYTARRRIFFTFIFIYTLFSVAFKSLVALTFVPPKGVLTRCLCMTWGLICVCTFVDVIAFVPIRLETLLTFAVLILKLETLWTSANVTIFRNQTHLVRNTRTRIAGVLRFNDLYFFTDCSLQRLAIDANRPIRVIAVILLYKIR